MFLCLKILEIKSPDALNLHIQLEFFQNFVSGGLPDPTKNFPRASLGSIILYTTAFTSQQSQAGAFLDLPATLACAKFSQCHTLSVFYIYCKELQMPIAAVYHSSKQHNTVVKVEIDIFRLRHGVSVPQRFIHEKWIS